MYFFAATSPYETDNASHTYSAVGNYTISVTATNVVGAVTVIDDVIVQHPVTRQFDVQSTAPLFYVTGRENNCSIRVRECGR